MSGPGKGGRRGYSWPPFEPGHELSTVTGAHSERRVGPLAEAIAAALLEADTTPAYVRDPSYAAAVRAYSRSEAVVSLLWDYLAGQDIEAALTDVTRSEESEERSKGRTARRGVSRRVASVLDQLHRAETRANTMRRELGLTPMARFRMGRDVTAAQFDLARAIAELDDREDGAGG